MSKVGTYVGVKYDRQSQHAIRMMTNLYNVPNVVAREKLHSTILYSRNPLNIPQGKKDEVYRASAVGLSVWEDNGKNILVLQLESEHMKARHDELMAMGGTHDFEDYDQHITLSYDIGDWKSPNEHSFYPFMIYTSVEYCEELVLDWESDT